MRSILLTLATIFIGTLSYGQYLYGFSSQGFKRMDVNTGQDTVIFPNLISYGHDGSTSDLSYRYFTVKTDFTGINDTLLTIDLSHNTVTKDTIPFEGLLWPEFYNNKLYGLTANGFVVFDLQTKQLSTLNTGINSMNVYKASMNQSTGVYMFLKSVIAFANPDTICSYNVGTGTYTTDTIPNKNYNFEYCTNANKAFMIGIENGVKTALFSYDMTTQVYSQACNLGTLAGIPNIATTDPVNNKYYFFIVGTAPDTLATYSMASNTISKIPIQNSILSNIEFFPQLPTGVPNMTDEANNLTLYPNPASEVLRVKLSGDKQWQLSVTDVSGKVLMHQPVSHSTNIDISPLAAGQYFVTITDGVKSGTHQFQKQ